MATFFTNSILFVAVFLMIFQFDFRHVFLVDVDAFNETK